MTNDSTLSPVFAILAAGVGVSGAVIDVRSRLIPNRLTGPAMLVGLSLHYVVGGWSECGQSFFGLLLCGAIFLVFHLAGGMGAGDVKFIAAEGCLLGFSDAIPLLVYTALCGGILGATVAVRRGMLRGTLMNVFALANHHSRHGLRPHPQLNVLNRSMLRLPYGLAIAAGAILTVLVPVLLRNTL